MFEGLFGSIAGIALLIIIIILVLHLLHSLVKAAIIIIALLAIANFVFGWSFGLGAVWDFATRHADISEEGVTLSLENPLNMESAVVARVIDGDTVELEDGSKVRLLGVNAPEKGQLCFEQAKEKLEERTLNKTIFLETDGDEIDDYNRLLRYIWVGTNLVNKELLEDGLAHVYTYGADLKYATDFYAAQQDAMESDKCLWPKSEYADCISISKFQFDAEDNDNENLNQEFVVFKNSCEGDINMTGWTIKDESASNMYTFSVFTAESDEEFTLFSGKRVDTNTEIYWGRTRAVWNNNGDTLFFRDKQGDLVLSETYQSEE